MILVILAWEIYDNCPFINPSHDDEVILINSLLDYLFFNLIAQHILFYKKKLELQKEQKEIHGVPSPPSFKMLHTNCPKQLEPYTFKRKGRKNRIQTSLYMLN
jgi:hypothetical protein